MNTSHDFIVSLKPGTISKMWICVTWKAIPWFSHLLRVNAVNEVPIRSHIWVALISTIISTIKKISIYVKNLIVLDFLKHATQSL